MTDEDLVIDLPLLLPFAKEIRERLLKELPGDGCGRTPSRRRVIFAAPGLDAAGVQLIVALKKEFPGVEIVLNEEGSSRVFFSLLRKEVDVLAEDTGR